MNIKSILYLDKPGKAGCSACLAAAAERAVELGLKHAVVASSSGQTALDLATALKKAGSKARVVAVSYAANYAAKWGRVDPRIKAKAEKLGVTFTTAGHAMSGINTAIQETVSPLGYHGEKFGSNCFMSDLLTLISFIVSFKPYYSGNTGKITTFLICILL